VKTVVLPVHEFETTPQICCSNLIGVIEFHNLTVESGGVSVCGVRPETHATSGDEETSEGQQEVLVDTGSTGDPGSLNSVQCYARRPPAFFVAASIWRVPSHNSGSPSSACHTSYSRLDRRASLGVGKSALP